jgi:hypothetical protein
MLICPRKFHSLVFVDPPNKRIFKQNRNVTDINHLPVLDQTFLGLISRQFCSQCDQLESTAIALDV